MSGAKHTPGPWNVGQDSSFGISVWGEEHVADVKNWGREERQANASLIAAAPELLEALSATVAVLRSFAAMAPQEGWAADEIAAVLRLADPAIAKATGEPR
jgi:hypothetical protein